MTLRRYGIDVVDGGSIVQSWSSIAQKGLKRKRKNFVKVVKEEEFHFSRSSIKVGPEMVREPLGSIRKIRGYY